MIKDQPTEIALGIVVGTTKYAENNLIVRIFTRQHGLRSFVVSSTGRKKKSSVLPLTMPLSVVEVEALSKRAKLERIKEIHLATPFATIPFDPVKRAISLFISELLHKSLTENGPDEALFEFLHNAILAFDEGGMKGAHNFHIFVMFELSRLLGFAPEVDNSSGDFFDLDSGVFVGLRPDHPYYLSGDDLRLWRQLRYAHLDSLDQIATSRTERQRLISLLSQYYQRHIPSWRGVESQDVLGQIF